VFLIFTPYTYLFVSFYFLVLSFIFSIRNFYLFWLYIEILMLLFIGVSYTLFTNSYSQLITYFLYQTLASFCIIVFFLLDLKFLVLFSIFLKLGIFPFFSWYLNCLFRFPSFLIFLATTIHKLPPLYIIYLIFDLSVINFTILFLTFRLIIARLYMLITIDLRYLIIISSIGNNSFLILAVLSNNLNIFLFFFFIYLLNTFFLLNRFYNISSHSLSFTFSSFFSIYLIFLLFNIASLPPLPGFFSKFFVLFSFFSSFDSYNYFVILLLLLSNVLIIISYVKITLKYTTNIYSNTSSYFLF